MNSPFKKDPTPVYEVPFDNPELVAKANKNGSIIVNKDLVKDDKLMDEAMAHEKYHLKDMMNGDLDYDAESVTYKGKKYDRSKFNEGNPNLYVQWALIYSKKHPILKRTIKLICKNIENNSYPNSIHKMTGPTVYTKAIYRIHNELFNQILCNKYRNKDTDKTFTSNNISYRIYGIDYNEYFTFKHDLNHLLFVNNKKHWVQEEKEKSLLKKD